MIVQMKSHPRGLPVLFMTEVWERFGFYIVQAMLILYMTHQFDYSDSKAAGILGAFTALAYILPVIGGYLADRVYGFQRSVIIGGVLLTLGYAMLGSFSEQFFQVALSVIVIGTGFFKPNVSSLVGALYRENPKKRDAGFTIFYVGINTGIILATLSSGFIQRNFGWGTSFSFASVGIFVGTLTFLFGRKRLDGVGLPPKLFVGTRLTQFLHHPLGFILTVGIATILATILFHFSTFADSLFALTGLGMLVYLFINSFQYEDRGRNRLRALLVLILAAVVFWSVFFQMFFATNLFIDRVVERTFFGFNIPTVAFISVEPFFILLLGPFFAKLWQKLAKRGKNPLTPTKFTLSLFVTAFGFFALAAGVFMRDANGRVNPIWVVLGYFLITVGEILLSPIGLSAVIKLSPPKIVGMMMGMFFFSLGYGGDIAGIIATWADIPKTMDDLRQMGDIYQAAFLNYAYIALGAGFVLLLLLPKLNQLIQTPKDTSVVPRAGSGRDLSS